MKLKIILVLFLMVFSARADLLLPDLLTPHTNTVSSHGYITITNNAVVYVAGVSAITNGSGVVTNIAVSLGTNFINDSPYFVYNKTNISYGDPQATAWQDESNNVVYLQFLITNSLATGGDTATVPSLTLGTPWTNTYGAAVTLIVDGTITTAIGGTVSVTLTNMTSAIGHVIAGSTLSLAGSSYWSYAYRMQTNDIVELYSTATGSDSAALTQTTARVK